MNPVFYDLTALDLRSLNLLNRKEQHSQYLKLLFCECPETEVFLLW
jgi:hypothetical protein